LRNACTRDLNKNSKEMLKKNKWKISKNAGKVQSIKKLNL